MIKEFIKDESGVTAVEYGLIAALLGVVAIPGFRALGVSLGEMYDGVQQIVLNSVP